MVESATGKVVVKSSIKGNARSFKAFLVKILYEYRFKKKIIVVLDNVKYHHAKVLKPFLKNHQEQLELIFLPPYSPDFNPMERVWWYMRKKITHHRYCQSLEERKIVFWKMFSHFQNENEFIINLCNINYSV